MYFVHWCKHLKTFNILKMQLISKLPYELVIHVYEYNPLHREQMKWVFKDIRDISYCVACDKRIIKYVYTMRGCDKECCSMECVDSL